MSDLCLCEHTSNKPSIRKLKTIKNVFIFVPNQNNIPLVFLLMWNGVVESMSPVIHLLQWDSPARSGDPKAFPGQWPSRVCPENHEGLGDNFSQISKPLAVKTAMICEEDQGRAERVDGIIKVLILTQVVVTLFKPTS